MSTILLLASLATSIIFVASCGGTAGNSAPSSSNKDSNFEKPVSALDANAPPANLPAGISTSPLSPPANASATNHATPKPATTPGIPSAAEMKKQAKPGTTPTPGIPSVEELRKALAKPVTNSNSSLPSMMKEEPMMRSNRKPSDKP